MARWFLVILVLILGGSVLYAQDTSPRSSALPDPADAPLVSNAMLQKEKPSHPEQIILAYYKMAGATPEYDKWTALSPYLDAAMDSEISSIISREHNRLLQAYNSFDVSKPLVVHTNLSLDDYSTINGVLELSEFSPKTFFTFSLYGEHIALIPRDIKNFGKIPLSRKQMDTILSKTNGSRILAELLLKPSLADTKEPFMHNKVPYHLLLSEIAEIRFWNTLSTPELVWTWRADWYKLSEDKKLLDLKESIPNGTQP